MTTLVITDPLNGGALDAAVIANANAAIKAVVNGSIDNGNIASGAAISGSKLAGLVSYAGALASAATISPTVGRNVIHLLTGTTTVNTITAGTTGDILTLVASAQASGVCVVLGHRVGNINLRGGHALGIYAQVPADTAAGAGESITFLYDGTYWTEITSDLRTVLSYQQRTSSIDCATGTEATPLDVIVGDAITYDGATRIMVGFFAPYASNAAGSNPTLNLWEDTTDKGYLILNAQDKVPVACSRIYVPAAGSKTLKARGWRSTGAGIASFFAGVSSVGTNVPAYLGISRYV